MKKTREFIRNFTKSRIHGCKSTSDELIDGLCGS